MRPLLGNCANRYLTQVLPALHGFADECCGMLARLVVYVGALALLAIGGIHLWDELPPAEAAEPTATAAWTSAERPHPAFAVSQFNLPDKTETYEILRHPGGGRKEIFRWAVQGQKPIAELEIYRPGSETGRSGPVAELAARMDPDRLRGLEPAGVIASKFGAAALFRVADDRDGANSCLGFIKRLHEANLRISGWSCQGNALPARRAAVGCLLSRLILLTAGNDPKLAETFARAELNRTSCTAPKATDWVTAAETPGLRGTF
jgi:hypothetical protein